MARKFKKFYKNQIFGDWKLIQRLDGGGNGIVWEAENQKSADQNIIKLLKKDDVTARSRFLDEIKIISGNQDIDGVMRILDSASAGDEDLWYVMPKAQTLNKYLSNKSSIVKVNAVLEIAQILSELHAKGVSHRDIKPQNLFHHDHFIIGDFGLVDYPDKEGGLTLAGRSLGPRYTIAPEMRNSPEKSDGLKADVYSLSKTLWILLTNRSGGFEGQYSPQGSIGLGKHVPDLHLVVLEDLLFSCTENDPDQRPNINEFIDILSEWVDIQANYFKKNDLDWRTIQYKLFPLSVPAYAEWTDFAIIGSILNTIGEIKSLNHMFFPNGGGIDLEGAKMATEDGLLELDFSGVYIVKPKRLSFCSFDGDSEWTYFYLELDELEHIYDSYKGRERLIELTSGEYKPDDFIENYYEKYDDGVTARPTNYRPIIRLSGGSFVVFRKSSSYNMTSTTYDGRHEKMGPIKFREYIQMLVDIGYKALYIRDEETGKIAGKEFTHDIRSYDDYLTR